MSTRWELALTLDGSGREPVFLQIARAVADDVKRGRLRAGDAIPGSRSLARTLSVHRNTVLAAYRELEAEGWIKTAPGRGTFVSDAMPDTAPRRFAASAAPRTALPARPGFELRPGPEPYAVTSPHARGALAFGGGLPDLRLVPVAPLARAYRRALRGRGRDVLGYGDPRGHPELRSRLATMLSAVRGLSCTADSILVTRGSQMALDLLARTLLAANPRAAPAGGEVVAVEALGYRPAWEAFRLAGARLAALPVDASGVSVDALADLASRERVRAVYVTPHHQYPTTVGLAAGRRLALLELARRHRIAIVEDDYDHEFHYDGRPVLPLASADRAGVVIYVGTLSKILAPGLRLGFVVAPEPLVERLAARRVFVDREGDHAVECAVAELLDDGEVQRHARRVRRAYRARRDALVDALRRELGGALEFEPPAGGMALWVRVAEAIDVDAWAARAEQRGAIIQTGRRFAFDGRARPHARLGFASLNERELAEAVRRLAAAL